MLNTPIAVRFVRLFYGFRLLPFKRALNLKLMLTLKLRLYMRSINPNARLAGHDRRIDEIIHIASLRVLDPESFRVEQYPFLFKRTTSDVLALYGRLCQQYKMLKSEVDELVDRLASDPDVNQMREQYYLILDFANRFPFARNDEAAEYFLSRARELNPQTQRLDENGLSVLKKRLKKDIKELWNEVADRTALKMSMSLSDIGSVIPVFSAVFVVSGYLYNRFLLGAFGIDVSRYFSLADYLAASINRIGDSAFAAVIALVGVYLGAYGASRRALAVDQSGRGSRMEYWPYALLLTAITSVGIGYVRDQPELFYNSVQLFGILATMHYSPALAARYFKNPLQAVFALVFVFSFAVHLYADIGKEVHAMQRDGTDRGPLVVVFTEEIHEDQANLVLIAANTGYLFLLHRFSQQALVVPKDRVAYLKYEIRDARPRLLRIFD